MDDLKGCPFCGGRAKVRTFTTSVLLLRRLKSFYVECTVCRVRTSVELEEETAVEVWNRRVENAEFGG